MKICHRKQWIFTAIQNRNENMDVIDAIISFSNENNYNFSYWIGGNDLANSGEFWWQSIGKPVGDFVSWDKDEPNVTGHCMQILDKNLKRGLQWSVDNCRIQKPFICSSLKL